MLESMLQELTGGLNATEFYKALVLSLYISIQEEDYAMFGCV